MVGETHRKAIFLGISSQYLTYINNKVGQELFLGVQFFVFAQARAAADVDFGLMSSLVCSSVGDNVYWS